MAAEADLAARQEVGVGRVASLPADLLADVRHVSARSMDSITLTMKKGTEIKWGSADESDRKVEVLRCCSTRSRPVDYDVSVPSSRRTGRTSPDGDGRVAKIRAGRWPTLVGTTRLT